MTLTAKEALGHVRHALSSDKMPTVGGLRILNDAGESLVNMHSWRWLEGAQAYLSLRSGVDHVWLPENFRELMSLVASNSLNSGISLTTPDQIARHRADSSGSALHYMAAVVFATKEEPVSGIVLVKSNLLDGDWVDVAGDTDTVRFVFKGTLGTDTAALVNVPFVNLNDLVNALALADAINACPNLNVVARVQAGTNRVAIEQKVAGAFIPDTFSFAVNEATHFVLVQPVQTSGPGGAPRPRLDLWPTPGADKVDGLTAYFRAGWRSIRGDKDTISVPAFMEPLYIQMVRTFALGYERDSEADISRRLSGLRNSTMFKDCRTRDSLLHPSYGPSINGAAAGELTGASAMWNFGDIGGPG